MTANWILLSAIHSLWLSLAGFFIMRLLKFRAAAVRSAWGVCILFALFFLPLMTWFIPRFSGHSVEIKESVAATSVAIADAQEPFMNRLLDITAPLSQEHASRWKERANQFGMLWLAISFIVLARLLYQLAYLKGYCTDLQEARDSRLSAILQENCRAFRFRKRPQFFASPKLASPVSAGIFKPLVILPAKLYPSLDNDELRAIVLHELAHINHHDHALGLLQRIMKALYWWNPFVYSLCNSLSLAREEISDNHAIKGMGSAAGYAGLLVSLVEKTSFINRLPCTAGLGTPYNILETRIKNILAKERDMSVKIKRSALTLILVAVGLLCGVVIIGSQAEIFGIAQASTSSPIKSAVASSAHPASEEARYTYFLSKLLVQKVDPLYPELGIAKRVSGKAELSITVNDQGRVSDIKVAKGNPMFTDAASAAVKQWILHPCTFARSKGKVEGPVNPANAKVKKLPYTLKVSVIFSIGPNDIPKISLSASDYKYSLN